MTLRSLSRFVLLLAATACPRRPPSPPDAAPVAAEIPTELTFAEGTREKELVSFCEATLEQTMKCFEDETFWQIFATVYFGAHPEMDDGNPQTRDLWIGMRKDDVVKFAREGAFTENCQVMVRRNRWPDQETQRSVDEARRQSCPAFANAYARMLFVDGVFSKPRTGEPP